MKKKRGAILVIGLLLVLGLMVLFTAGCGNTDRGSDLGMEDLVTPVVTAADPAQLPADFNKIEMGMTTTEVKDLVDFPATIQELDGKLVYKYFVNEGRNRLYINFVDDKVESMELSTP